MLVIQHLVVFLAAILRMILLFIRTNPTTNQETSVAGLAFLSALPYMLESLAFTFLVFNW